MADGNIIPYYFCSSMGDGILVPKQYSPRAKNEFPRNFCPPTISEDADKTT
jgi:hypothetical protein